MSEADAVDYAEKNRQHFNDIAHKYDEIPFALELSKQNAGVILKEYPFSEDSTVLMEFACGTGLISRELAPYAKKIVGVDISQGMVDQYNLRVANQGIDPEEMSAVCANLKGVDGELDGLKFDVIVCVASYHHFGSIDDVTRMLMFFLKPGGSLIVMDLIRTPDGELPFASRHGHEHGVATMHHTVVHKGGFEERDIRKAFDSAQLEQVTYRPATRVANEGKSIEMFVAKGIKPSGKATSDN